MKAQKKFQVNSRHYLAIASAHSGQVVAQIIDVKSDAVLMEATSNQALLVALNSIEKQYRELPRVLALNN